MKARVESILKLTINGQEIELSRNGALELHKALGDALGVSDSCRTVFAPLVYQVPSYAEPALHWDDAPPQIWCGDRPGSAPQVVCISASTQ